MSTPVPGKVVWLTGATSGIGESLAYELAAKGATLILSARRAGELERVRAACSRPEEHLLLPIDLVQTDTLSPAVETVLRRFGHVDILIHCAGVSQRGAVVDAELEVHRYVMNLNYFAPLALTKLVLPSMIARHSGHIVAVSSLLGKFGAPKRSAYCASKHALIGFCDALRAEVYKYGITVTVICPGFVRTNASQNALQADGTPYGKTDADIRNGTPSDECARKIVRAIEAGRREVYIGKKWWAVYVARFFPGVFSRFVRRRRPK